ATAAEVQAAFEAERAAAAVASEEDEFVDVAEDDPIMNLVLAAAQRNGIDMANATSNTVERFSSTTFAETSSDGWKKQISEYPPLIAGGIKSESLSDFTDEDILITVTHVDTDVDTGVTTTNETYAVLREINGSLEPIFMKRSGEDTKVKEEGEVPILVKGTYEYWLFTEDSYNETTREGQFFDVTDDADGLEVATIETQKDVLVTQVSGEQTWRLESRIGLRWFDGEWNNITATKAGDTVASVDLFFDPASGDLIDRNYYDVEGNLLATDSAAQANPSDNRPSTDSTGGLSDPGTHPGAIPPTVDEVRGELQRYAFAAIDTVMDWTEEAGKISNEHAEEYRAIDETYLADNRLQILQNRGSKLSSYGLSEDQISAYKSELDAGGEDVARAYLATLGLLSDEQLDGVFNITIADGQGYFLSLHGEFTEEEIINIVELSLEDFLTTISMGFTDWTIDYIMNANLKKTREVMTVITQAINDMEFDKTLNSIAGDFEELQEQASLMIKGAVLNGSIAPLSVDDVTGVPSWSVENVIGVLDLILQDLQNIEQSLT
ncbi:MAG: hypothetical protein P9X27_01715, partial [Candidatus Kaelpia aquatica]|nr:hypothetical protein [Candidatus Kaelpia aquatica]